MPVSSYPRVTVQGTGTAQNTQNGQALMLVNPSTGKYEAATAATFAGGGGGGGDATAANQTLQISEAVATNNALIDAVAGYTVAQAAVAINNNLSDGNSAAQFLNMLNTLTIDINKYSKWNTFTTKIFSSQEGACTFSFPPNTFKIVFYDNTYVTSLRNVINSDVKTDYIFANGGGNLDVGANTEIISIGDSADAAFKDIEIHGKVILVAYSLITPFL